MKQIPSLIRSRVLTLWLLGLPRDEIAVNTGIGAGSVSRIILDIKSSDIPDIDLLRGLVKSLLELHLSLSEFADIMRLYTYLSNRGISIEKVERLIEEVEAYCFRSGYDDIEKFILKIKSVTWQIPRYFGVIDE